MNHEKIIILDFGSQYTQLIARKIREMEVYCEIQNYDWEPGSDARLKGIILSGGPSSVYAADAPLPKSSVWSAEVPILGICYGMQAMALQFGGEILRGEVREYGSAHIALNTQSSLFFQGMDSTQQVWMSHSDQIRKAPQGFAITAHSDNGIIAAFESPLQKRWGVQFHPEVIHTPHGQEMLHNFIYRICQCRGDWKMSDFITEQIESIRCKVGNRQVILALSGGVDSSVTAALLHRALGDQLRCFFIDNGLIRKNEQQKVAEAYALMGHLQIEYIDAGLLFLERLAGITDPEKKRKIIGHSFIEVFENQLNHYPNAAFLAQGTLYPDVIESLSYKGPSATIKTHHNVGGLPDSMKLELIEPLRELFKDEVRRLGAQLAVPERILHRHPFPGPGLAVRIPGEITSEKLEILRDVDEIFIDALIEEDYYRQISQALAVLLPVKTVGVMGDERTYQYVAALRAVVTTDFMTAEVFPFPAAFLTKLANRIINKVSGVNRVVYDISSKPPATIEWE